MQFRNGRRGVRVGADGNDGSDFPWSYNYELKGLKLRLLFIRP